MQQLTSGVLPDCLTRNIAAMNAAVDRERTRRRQIGDTASITQYNRERQLVSEGVTRPEAEDEMLQESLEAQAEGRDVGFWGWLPPAVAVITRKFLRGEPITGPSGEGPATAPAPDAAKPVVTLDAAPVPAVPPPDCWEPEWGPEDTAAMEAWNGREPGPDGYTRAFAAMEAAIRRESARRRRLGDEASVTRYTRERERLTGELGEPEVEEEWQRKMEEARARGDLGFWDWFSPPISRLTRAFLRGEGSQPPTG